MSLLVAAYFALWLARRERVAIAWAGRAGTSGGVLGALGGIFGLTTGGCTGTNSSRLFDKVLKSSNPIGRKP